MTMKNSRANRHLEARAKNQDIAAAFQLYQDRLDKDDSSSNQYLELCEKILKSSSTKLKLTKTNFIDFRRFNNFNIDFHQNLTVIIGDNGYGKTTIADGIVKTLSWIIANIEKANNIGKRITSTDINVNSKQYAEINAEFSITKSNRYSISLSKAVAGAAKRKDSIVTDIKALADLYRIINAQHEIDLPVFAFYSVDRSRITKSHVRERWDKIKVFSRLDAYNGCLESESSFSNFIEWFASLANKTHHEINVTQKQIEEYQALDHALQELIKNNKLSYDSDIWKAHEKSRLAFLPPEQDAVAAKHLKIIKSIITKFIPTASDVIITRRSGNPELKVHTTDGIVGVNMLSQGQKSLLGMIGDLTRRLIALNPKKENPLTGQGIVIIDEIELHLHPKWQQDILQNLQEAFPEIQFIVTTHSPQVLTTVSRENIRAIEETESGCSAAMPAFSPLAHESGDALAKVMGTHREPNLPLQRSIRQFEKLVRSGQEDSYEALQLRTELDKAGYQIHESDLIAWRFLAKHKAGQGN